MPTAEQYLTRLIEWVELEDYVDASDELETLINNGVAEREAFDMIVDIYSTEEILKG